jgi:hypothetical protein
MANTDQPQARDAEANRIHKETGAAWEIAAKAGYNAEIEEDIEFIRDGGISLMDGGKTCCPYGIWVQNKLLASISVKP